MSSLTESSASRDRTRAGAIVAIVIAVAVLHSSLLDGRTHVRGEDDLELTIPYNVAFWRAIDRGDSPWWLPWTDGGTSLFTHFPYLGPFYPAALLFRGLEPTRAVEIALLAHVLIAALGTRAWARAIGASEPAAVLAALVCAGSSVWRVADFEGYGTEAPVWAWLPWALAAIERARTGSATREGALAGLAVGLLVLGGHATDLYVGLGATALYLGARCIALRHERHEVQSLLTATLLAGAFGVSIGAIYWLPVARTVDWSDLDSARPIKALISHPLLRLVTPLDHWGSKDSLYIGVTTLVWIALASLSHERRSMGPSVAVVGASLALSFGPGSLPWRALSWLPGFAHLDQANVFSWPVATFAAVLAGIGFDTAKTWSHAPTSTRIAAIAVGVLMLWGSPILFVVVTFLTLFCAAYLWIWARDARRSALPTWHRTFVALTVIELLAYSIPSHDDSQMGNAEKPIRSVQQQELGEQLSARAELDQPCRLLPLELTAPERETQFWRNDSMLLGVEDVRASAHLASPRHRHLLRSLGPWPVDWDSYSDDRVRAPRDLRLEEGSNATRILDLLGVTTLATDVAVEGDAFEARGKVGELALWSRATPVPRYRLVTSAIGVRDGEAALTHIISGSFDPRTEVLIEAGISSGGPPALGEPRASSPADLSRVRVERYRPGDIELDVDAHAGETLVIGESWMPGWTAMVDGEPAPLLRVNYVHFAVAPRAGKHRVHLSYRPVGLRLGSAIAALSLAIALGLVLAPRLWPETPAPASA